MNLRIIRASLVAQSVKSLPAMQVTWGWSLVWEDPLEKEMATHSRILAWRIPWTEEPGGLQSMGSQRVGHDCHYLHFQNYYAYLVKEAKQNRIHDVWFYFCKILENTNVSIVTEQVSSFWGLGLRVRKKPGMHHQGTGRNLRSW